MVGSTCLWVLKRYLDNAHSNMLYLLVCSEVVRQLNLIIFEGLFQLCYAVLRCAMLCYSIPTHPTPSHRSHWPVYVSFVKIFPNLIVLYLGKVLLGLGFPTGLRALGFLVANQEDRKD